MTSKTIQAPKRVSMNTAPRLDMATLTGLEPATSAVTGRRANQLRHRAIDIFLCTNTEVLVPPTGFEPVPPP